MSTIIDVLPFERALKEFRSSLAPREESIFTQCQSPEELINHVRSLEIIKKTQKHSALLQRVSKFSNSLSHYFDVIGILVQSHPEYAALAWGAFRLVLQLASNFHEFFDKLTKTLSRLAEVLPWYEDLTTSLKGVGRDPNLPHQGSSRLVNSLTRIYVDLFVFLQSVVRIFTKKDTSNRSKFVICNSLFWKPYDSRFEDILETMHHHRELLKMELSLHAQQATHLKLTQEHEQLKKELLGIADTSSARQQNRCEGIRRRIEGLAAMLEKAQRESSVIETKLVEIDAKSLLR